jgi:hypothetical protein
MRLLTDRKGRCGEGGSCFSAAVCFVRQTHKICQICLNEIFRHDTEAKCGKDPRKAHGKMGNSH